MAGIVIVVAVAAVVAAAAAVAVVAPSIPTVNLSTHLHTNTIPQSCWQLWWWGEWWWARDSCWHSVVWSDNLRAGWHYC